MPAASRVLVARPSRERSPRRSSEEAALVAFTAVPPPAPGGFKKGQTVVFSGLSTRPELDGSLGVVVPTDAVAERVAVRVSSTGLTIRVKPQNIASNIFGARAL